MIVPETIILVIARNVSCIAIGVAALLIYQKKKNVPCETCQHLARKGGGIWKYECDKGDLNSTFFDKPPSYCKRYEKREEKDDGEE